NVTSNHPNAGCGGLGDSLPHKIQRHNVRIRMTPIENRKFGYSSTEDGARKSERQSQNSDEGPLNNGVKCGNVNLDNTVTFSFRPLSEFYTTTFISILEN
ncbi:hypothetical protein L9F63_000323, partial [Diploptera punctata]